MMAVARLLRVALVVPLFFPGQARYSSAVCPSDSMIHPCSCTRVALGIRVLCSSIANEHYLRTILGYLSSYKLNALSLEHINFTLTPDLFDRLQVITVRVMESQFRMENPFELRATGGTSRIEALNVRQSTLDLGDSSLAILQGLRQVDVVNSAIRVLRRRWFNGMSRLNRLVIEHTKMGRLEDRALAGLNEVEKVVLKANELKSLRRSYFPQLAARLAHLDFRNPLYITQEGRCKDIRMSKRQPSATSRSTEQRTPKNQNTLPCNLDKKTRMWVYWLYHLTKCQRNQNTVCHTKMKILTCSRQSS
ncbi:uncharacterized protein [Dermacentor andersoni]|uniref:uncharacterized protein isoform X6 n=1 Tax=Dermacentor andersoni TaxID=34620 RepID=UPI002415FC13|nr:uncharacterized protein LOC126519732 isoform X5 [Dermacentor andersoni]